MKKPLQQIWIRLAITLQVTESEMDILVNHGLEQAGQKTLWNIFSSGRAEWGHDCYIPCDVIDLYNEQTGKAYDGEDVTLEAQGLEGRRIYLSLDRKKEFREEQGRERDMR